MKDLRLLNLRFTQVTDEGLDVLRGLTSLQMLTLPQAATDTSLEHLTGMNRLMSVYYSATGSVTQQGIERLSRALPKSKCLYYTPQTNR